MVDDKSKLKIAVVVKAFVTTGGAERYAVEIAKRMVDKGHKVDLYCRVSDADEAKGMGVFTVPERYGFSSALSLYAFARDTAAMFTKKQYDIVHSHDRGFLHDISTVHTFSFKTGVEKMSPLKKLNEIYLSLRARLYLWLEAKQMASPMLVAVSDLIKTDIRQYHGREDDVFVVAPGVDTRSFSFVPFEDRCHHTKKKKTTSLVILFIGSEFKRKGLEYLIASLERDMELIVVGRGDHWKFFRNLVKKRGLEENVRFKGLKDNIFSCYREADVLVLPSKREAFGMTVLEAMSCGLPVVASAAVGAASLIDPDENGFVFHQPSELKPILKKLMDKKLRKRMGVLARKTAKNYTWDHAADQYEKIYHRLVCRKEKEEGRD